MNAFMGKALAIAAIALLLWFAVRVVEVFLIAFAGVLLATLIRSISVPLARIAALPDRLAVVLVALSLVASLAAGIWFAGDQVAAQVEALWQRLPAAIERVETWLRQTKEGAWLAEGFGSLESRLAIGPLTLFATTTLGAVVNVFLILATGIYFAVDPGLYLRGAASLAPVSVRPAVEAMLTQAGQALKHWLLGHVIGMISMAVLTGVGLSLLGIPYALALGLVAGLLEFVPVLGPVLAALPAVLIALAQDPQFALAVVAFYIVIQQIESYLIIPMAQQWSVSLPPALGLLSVVAMGLAFGFLGVVLATPIIVVVMAMLRFRSPPP